jgi:hypothetical protein
MSAGAAAQVVDYRAHRDGLKYHQADPTWHPDPIPVFDYERAIDVQLSDKLPNGSTVGDALVAVLKMQQRLSDFRRATYQRDVALRKRLNQLGREGRIQRADLDELLSELVDDEPDEPAPTKGKS